MADEPVRVLTVTAHPDDTEFGFGGTIARWADEGRLIWYCIATNGDKGTSDRSLTPPQLAAIRQKEQLAAAKTLGVQDVFFLGYPDGGLEPHKVGELYISGTESSDTVVDISGYIDRKIEALRCHRSQMQNADTPDFAERFKMNAARSGEPFGVSMAGAFRRIELRR